jgi:hypothetical protein
MPQVWKSDAASHGVPAVSRQLLSHQRLAVAHAARCRETADVLVTALGASPALGATLREAVLTRWICIQRKTGEVET